MLQTENPAALAGADGAGNRVAGQVPRYHKQSTSASGLNAGRVKPLGAALAFAARGWRVFPCIPRGPERKHPLTPNGFHQASSDPAIITAWWCRWPDALIGAATGAASGFVVLDVDVKHRDSYGFDALDALGFAILPETPMVHTGSGGLHLYFALPLDVEICAGLARARAQGKRLGRPPLGRGVTAAVRQSLAAGVSIRQAAVLHGVGISSVQRIRAQAAE